MNSDNADLGFRLRRLKMKNPEEMATIQQRLASGLPPEYMPWPYGMPSSADPYVVIIGASPGNSPDPSDLSGDRSYDPPTFGHPHTGFFYGDTKYYWDKVRFLCSEVINVASPELSTNEALALSGHLNLGVGQSGVATDAVVDDEIISWVSHLLGSELTAKVVITFGLNGILTKSARNTAWNEAHGTLPVNWRNPQRSYPFQNYSFRVWETKRMDGEPVLVCMWPNHPSRHPFTGAASGESWRNAVVAFCEILRSSGYGTFSAA